MATEKRLYIVSFGDSRQYRLELPATKEGEMEKESILKGLESNLTAYLSKLLPTETFAYFTTAKVEEVTGEKEADYASYPPLDEAALAEIKETIRKEAVNENYQNEIDSDAPFNDVPA